MITRPAFGVVPALFLCLATLPIIAEARNCRFQDVCSSKTIGGPPGAVLTDACGSKWTVNKDCSLERTAGQTTCGYLDVCSGRVIAGRKGSLLKDSCGARYLVHNDCSLTNQTPGGLPKERVSLGQQAKSCPFIDYCSGEGLMGARGGILVDSCGDTYRIGLDCHMKRIGGQVMGATS